MIVFLLFIIFLFNFKCDKKIWFNKYFLGSANELQIANFLAQAKTIASDSSEKSLFVLWIALGYANPTEIITEPKKSLNYSKITEEIKLR